MKIVGFVIKGLVLVGIIMLGVFLYLSCSGGSCIQRLDKMPPDIEKAPWEVRTPTHVYYAEKADKSKAGDFTMTGWYEFVKEEWIYHKEPVTLPRGIYGDIGVGRR